LYPTLQHENLLLVKFHPVYFQLQILLQRESNFQMILIDTLLHVNNHLKKLLIFLQHENIVQML
jgi:hypothetical protein